jgi:hypothetical protein
MSRSNLRATAVLAGLTLAGVALGPLALPGIASASTGTSTISGSAWADTDRDGVYDNGEAPFAGRLLLLFNADGTNVASTQTDANGRYAFGALADGSYTVAFSTPDWWDLRSSWVPTTTGSLSYSRTISLAGAATADIGLRPIVRSTDSAAPISTYTAASGLVVNSYDDAVSASELYTALTRGSLLGPEAATTTIYFDFGTQTDATTSVAGSTGTFHGFTASLWISYLSWLDNTDAVLFHEYGHSWSIYNADVVQQDDTLTSYLQARGIAGDSRLYSSKAWDPREMIAEDYRQLFGSATAASYPQANTDVPPASQVAGLKDFLQYTFTQPPAGGSTGGGSTGTTTTTSTSTTQPTVAVSNLAVSPTPVSKSGTVSFSLSQHATVTVTILNSAGKAVRVLLTNASASGSVATTWDRKDASGRRVKAGTYSAVVTATDDYGHVVNASAPFQVV